MCIQEHIAYQCGHRSPGVVRPCPMTTASENFAVCRTQATKQHSAFTMCTSCERRLHFRWVLIREWEHRWMHERGVCGCEVVFPGLLHQPRVSGFPPPSSSRPYPIATAVGSSGGPSVVPASYAETTAGGEHRVAVRVPGLYAAEWVADHRARHQAGQCHCAVNFEPFQPAVGEGELTREERALLHHYRELEDRNNSLTRADTAERVNEITSLFGSFDGVPLSSVPTTTTLAEAIPATIDDNSFYSHDQGHTQDHPQAHTHVSPMSMFRTQTLPHQQAQGHDLYPPQPAASPPQSRPQPGTWAPTFTPTQPLSWPDPITTQPATAHPIACNNPSSAPLTPTNHAPPTNPQNTAPQPSTTTARRALIVSTTHPHGPVPLPSGRQPSTPPSPHRLSTPPVPHPKTHPSFWPPAISLPTTPPTNLGPGPFTTAGLSYPPPSPPARHPARAGEQRTQSVPMPFCGLPIGAGPEGEAPHVRDWDACRLSRGTTPVLET
ncbi:hypothetical protein B0T25DRAFT_617085 [Lasiosphaeria hispida]|uniref:Uncharacterized protein n=1 Tax=Lasiosphaeria hispida TaxID=260671 RepID=A0AAJ0H7E3_9PEZI|nr:hypothetical protein B0T25DRAFT_617085 [Lasiosphaeria hispida]